MKKTIKLMTLVLSLLLLFGCQGKKVEKSKNDVSLEKMVEKLYDGVDKDFVQNLEKVKITKENIEEYPEIKGLDYEEALASEPLITSIPHSVILVKVKNNSDIEKIKKDIKSKANPRKWVCVAAKKVYVENNNSVIMLVMSDDKADKIKENFKKFK